ncbi:MAG: Ferredoxin--NAD(P)(+) reductase fdr [Alphaproteobacteria bacterium MarineAlpha5_Bin6]|nr:MAG: Ferredoxin--NAD(P)(+) reductase fdr [Alphaproteobacteria bacterium MarineAlpha5_Bin7]PPR54851.1 MAG: Ferredoxin--NAD(P)(+) reductase fdr [Alphaproteobacteria bacterium MarineAlpha5_Bin6]
MSKEIIIIGGGQTAANASKTIKDSDKSYNLSIFSNEDYLPYERPPLSKQLLTSEKKIDDCLFYKEEFYNENNINFLPNTEVEKIDFKEKLIFTGDKNYSYNKLLIASGSKNRILNIEGLNQNEIFYLRNIDECKKIIDKVKKIKNILIVGGGFIGLEIASSMSKLEKNITLVESSAQLMGRIIPEEISRLVYEKHSQSGVKIFLNTSLKSARKKDQQYQINLSNNEKIEVDIIIVGIGALPNTDFLNSSDINIDNGVVTNEYCETSRDNVYAAGDVSNFFHPIYNSYMRLESWKHAQDHGINAGKNIINQKKNYEEIPWMWSDQYDLNLQLTGICNDYDQKVSRGNNLDEGIIFFFIKKNIIMGACGVSKGPKIGKDIRISGIKIKNQEIIDINKIIDKNIKLQKI